MLVLKAKTFHRQCGKGVRCGYCQNQMICPPVLLVEENHVAYHPPCAMQMVYGILADLTHCHPLEHPQTVPKETEEERSAMVQAFHEAAQLPQQPFREPHISDTPGSTPQEPVLYRFHIDKELAEREQHQET